MSKNASYIMQKRHETGYDVYSPKDVKNDKRKKKQE